MSVSVGQKVGNFALFSRILVILMQAFFNFLIPDHDAKVFSPPNIHRQNSFDKAVDTLLGGFRRWDAIYFLHIAEYGYTYENTLAFFPLFPTMIRMAANSIFFPLQYLMNYSNVLLVSAAFINIMCFVQTTKRLCELTFMIFRDEHITMKVVQLFCLNPASIFFSAPYSEAMFAFLSFSGMLKVEENRFLLAAGYFAMSGATRSNGLINVAFIWHKQLKNFIEGQRHLLEKDKKFNWRKTFYPFITQILLQSVLYTLLVFCPFFIYQYYMSTVFCNPFATYRDLPVHILNYGNTNHYKMPHTGISPWCKSIIPLSYSYVQSKHWHLGFLSYYEFKQLPNFILAMPVVIIGTVSIVWFVRKNFWCCLTAGLMAPVRKSDQHADEPVAHGFCTSSNFVYVVHMVALIIFGMFYMHVQVLTRVICCSCPVFYFFLAFITTSTEESQCCNHDSLADGEIVFFETARENNELLLEKENPKETKPSEDGSVQMQAFLEWESSLVNRLVYIYLHLYFFVGIAAFSNFLPWT